MSAREVSQGDSCQPLGVVYKAIGHKSKGNAITGIVVFPDKLGRNRSISMKVMSTTKDGKHDTMVLTLHPEVMVEVIKGAMSNLPVVSIVTDEQLMLTMKDIIETAGHQVDAITDAITRAVIKGFERANLELTAKDTILAPARCTE